MTVMLMPHVLIQTRASIVLVTVDIWGMVLHAQVSVQLIIVCVLVYSVCVFIYV